MSKNQFSIVSIYIGTVIGAGFASGQEIISFLCVYGTNGLLGILLTVSMFIFFGFSILKLCKEYNFSSYKDMLIFLFGKKATIIFDILILLFLIIGFCVMVAGSGALLYQQFNINQNVGIFVMAFLCLITFMHNLKGIEVANKLVVPILIMGIFFIGVKTLIACNFNLSFINSTFSSNTNKHWAVSAISYVSYNLVPAFVILSSLKNLTSSNRDSFHASALSGLILGILAFFIFISCTYFYSKVSNLEIPMLYISDKFKIKWFYFLIIWLAMFTTAISNGFGFINRVSMYFNINTKIISLVFCIVCMMLSKIGFSSFIKIVYPMFGKIGFILLLLGVFKMIYYKITQKKKDFKQQI